MLISLRGEGLKRLIQCLFWLFMKALCSKVFYLSKFGLHDKWSVLLSMVGFFFISSRVDTVALGRKPKL